MKMMRILIFFKHNYIYSPFILAWNNSAPNWKNKGQQMYIDSNYGCCIETSSKLEKWSSNADPTMSIV